MKLLEKSWVPAGVPGACFEKIKKTVGEGEDRPGDAGTRTVAHPPPPPSPAPPPVTRSAETTAAPQGGTQRRGLETQVRKQV